MKEQINSVADNRPAAAMLPRLSSATGGAAGPEDWRILRQLEHGPQTSGVRARQQHWNVEQWIVGLGILSACICASAWYLQTRPPHSKTDASASLALTRLPPPRAPVQPLPTPPPVARIVLTPPANLPEPKQQVIHPAVQDTPAPAIPTMPTKITRTGAQRSLASASGTIKARAESTYDHDAALLAALVAHQHQAQPSILSANRDIVERRDADSTSQLIQRCQQLGLIEGLLCRSRICAERWDTDPACRQPVTTPQVP